MKQNVLFHCMIWVVSPQEKAKLQAGGYGKIEQSEKEKTCEKNANLEAKVKFMQSHDHVVSLTKVISELQAQMKSLEEQVAVVQDKLVVQKEKMKAVEDKLAVQQGRTKAVEDELAVQKAKTKAVQDEFAAQMART